MIIILIFCSTELPFCIIALPPVPVLALLALCGKSTFHSSTVSIASELTVQKIIDLQIYLDIYNVIQSCQRTVRSMMLENNNTLTRFIARFIPNFLITLFPIKRANARNRLESFNSGTPLLSVSSGGSRAPPERPGGSLRSSNWIRATGPQPTAVSPSIFASEVISKAQPISDKNQKSAATKFLLTY